MPSSLLPAHQVPFHPFQFRYKKESNPYIDVIAEELRACADACATIDARMQHVHDLRNM